MGITKIRDTLRHEAQAAEATRPGRGSLGTRGAPGLGLRSPVRVDSGRPAERAVRDPTVPSSWNAEHQSSFFTRHRSAQTLPLLEAVSTNPISQECVPFAKLSISLV